VELGYHTSYALPVYLYHRSFPLNRGAWLPPSPLCLYRPLTVFPPPVCLCHLFCSIFAGMRCVIFALCIVYSFFLRIYPTILTTRRSVAVVPVPYQVSVTYPRRFFQGWRTPIADTGFSPQLGFRNCSANYLMQKRPLKYTSLTRPQREVRAISIIVDFETSQIFCLHALFQTCLSLSQ